CLTSFQPLAMTETTTQPRFITRLPTGASLRGGSRRSIGSDKARRRRSNLLIGLRFPNYGDCRGTCQLCFITYNFWYVPRNDGAMSVRRYDDRTLTFKLKLSGNPIAPLREAGFYLKKQTSTQAQQKD